MHEAKHATFDDAYRQYVGVVYRFCLFRTNSREQAEDLTADVFAALLVNDGELDSDHLVPWLLKVAANRCVDEARRKRRERRLRVPPSGNGATITPWRDQDVWEALGQLRTIQQQVVYMRVVEDWGFSRVAEAIGRSEAATKMIFYRAAKRLSRLLGGER